MAALNIGANLAGLPGISEPGNAAALEFTNELPV